MASRAKSPSKAEGRAWVFKGGSRPRVRFVVETCGGKQCDGNSFPPLGRHGFS